MYTMEDFNRQYIKDHFARLTPEEQEEVLQRLPPERRLAGLPPEQRLAGLSPAQIRQYLDQLTSGRPAAPRKPRRFWKFMILLLVGQNRQPPEWRLPRHARASARRVAGRGGKDQDGNIRRKKPTSVA